MADPTPTSGIRRCVVTGAAGFIGSHLVDRLLADGHTVTGIDCFTDYYARPIKEANLTAARTHPRFKLLELDLRRDALDEVLAESDVVFHLAAMPGLSNSWVQFDEYVSCNVLATKNLLEAAGRVRTPHFIHVSTSSVYGLDSTGDETRPTQPISPYGVTKLAAEHLVQAYSIRDGLPYTILRYFSIYGPRQRPEMGYALFIDHVLKGKPIMIFGDGSQTRGNTYVDDCVDATVGAMRVGPTRSTFNLGGGELISALEAVRLIEKITGQKAQLSFGPARAGEQRTALADISRAQTVLGWSPRVGIQTGLTAQVNWQRTHR